MISFTHKGSFSKMSSFLIKAVSIDYMNILHRYGKEGVTALSAATPVDTGETASSWSYKIRTTKNGVDLSWMNSHREKGVPIAIIIQYGHATYSGGYVEGRDYINPALKPIFDKITNDIWRGVTTQ